MHHIQAALARDDPGHLLRPFGQAVEMQLMPSQAEVIDLGSALFATDEKRHLYAMSTPTEFARGRMKIGVAQDVAARATQLQTGQGEPLRVVLVWPHMEKLESLVLRMLPSVGDAGGTEWRHGSISDFKEAARRAFEEAQALAALPAASGKRKRDDDDERRFELDMARDKHRLEVEAEDLLHTLVRERHTEAVVVFLLRLQRGTQ